MHHRLTLVAAAAIAVLIQIALVAFDLPPLLGEDMVLAGPDSYMRLARVEHWWEAGLWYDADFPLANAPYGVTLHWTRPLDLLLVAGALPLRAFLGMRDALLGWGAAVGPALQVLTLLALSWGTRPFLSNGHFLLLATLLSIQPEVRNVFLIARPDHHGLLIFLFVLVFVIVLRIVSRTAGAKTARSSLAFLAGLAAGLAVWVSIEGLMPVFVTCVAFGLLWLWRGGDYVEVIAGFLQGVLVAVTVGLAAERPPSEWLTQEYDRVSFVHWSLFAVLAALWTALALAARRRDGRGPEKGERERAAAPGRMPQRLAIAAIGAGLPVLFMALAYPKFFGGPFVEVDPRIMSIWFAKISEVQPLLAFDLKSAGKTVIFLGPAFIAVFCAAYALRRAGPVAGGRDAAVYYLVALAVFIPLALYQIRWTAYAVVVAVVPWTELLAVILRRKGGRRFMGGRFDPLKVGLFLVVLLGHFVVGAALLGAAEDEDAASAGVSCRWQLMAEPLRSLAQRRGGPLTLVSFVHQGPEIIYRSGQRVVGTPYQRNAPGILDTDAILTAEDAEAARALLRRREVDYLVFCAEASEARDYRETKRDTLFKQIERGQLPPWLRPATLPPPAREHFLLLEVVDEERQ